MTDIKPQYALFDRSIIGAILFALIFNSSIYFTVAEFSRRTEFNIESLLSTLLQTTQEALHIWISNEKSTLTNWVDYNPPLDKIIAELATHRDDQRQLEHHPRQQQLRSDLKKLLHNKGYPSFYLLSDDYITLASTREQQLGLANLKPLVENTVSQRQLINGEVAVLNELYYLESGKVSNLYMAKAIFGRGNNVVGYFVVQLNPKLHFSNMLHVGRFGETGETYAFNHDGGLLSKSRFINTTDGTHLGLIRHETDGTAVTTLPMQKILSGQLSGANNEGYLDYRNEMVVGSWQWLEELNMGLVTEIDSFEAYHNLEQTKLAIGISQLITNILLLVMTVLNRIRQAQIYRFTLIDPLTGVGNRKHLETELKRVREEVNRNKIPATVMMLDVDKFKPYNDQFGHSQGDQALQSIARAVCQAVPRTTDVVTRYGGEEFCIILPFTDQDQAKVVANKILSEVVGLQLAASTMANHSVVTVSIGYYSFTPDRLVTSQQSIEQADLALYRAKELMGNVAINYQSLQS